MTAMPQALWVGSGVLLWIEWTLKYFIEVQQKQLQEGGAVLSLLDICFACVDHCFTYGYGLLI